MKILHTADWHLGRVLHGYSLEDYQAQFLDFFIDLVTQEVPEAVLIAGDYFRPFDCFYSRVRIDGSGITETECFNAGDFDSW